MTMRPELLNPLFTEVEALKGVGPGLAKALKRLSLTRAVDLIYHLPTGSIDRVHVPAVSHALVGRIVVVEVTPFEMRASAGRGPFRVYASDKADNTVTLTYFNNPGWAKKSLPLGEPKLVSGKLDAYGQDLQIVHPEVLAPDKAADLPLREPVYGLTEGITNRRMRELAMAALERTPELPEWIEPSLAAREAWRPWRAALAEAHADPAATDSRRRSRFCCSGHTRAAAAQCRFKETVG
jgi:ATP-dependent DNA helicase RecG